MVDWPNLLYNSLWILALAAALAVISRASWQASIRGTRLRDELAAPGPRTALRFAGALFCAGLALTAAVSLEAALWTVLAAGFFVLALLSHLRGSGR